MPNIHHVDKRQRSYWFKKELADEIKVVAEEKGKTVTDLLSEAMEGIIEEHLEKRIATAKAKIKRVKSTKATA